MSEGGQVFFAAVGDDDFEEAGHSSDRGRGERLFGWGRCVSCGVVVVSVVPGRGRS